MYFVWQKQKKQNKTKQKQTKTKTKEGAPTLSFSTDKRVKKTSFPHCPECSDTSGSFIELPALNLKAN